MNTITWKLNYAEFIEKAAEDEGCVITVAWYHHIGEPTRVHALIENGKTILFYNKALQYMGSIANTEKNYDSFLEELSEPMSEIGRYVICRNLDGEGRLRIHRSFISDIYRKAGWWDTFTLSDANTKVGKDYLCQIKKFAYDKDNHTILIVHPITEIDNDLTAYLSHCYHDTMSSIYAFERYSSLNLTAAFRAVSEAEFFADPSNTELHDKIRAALYSKTDEELEKDAIRELAKTNEVVAKKIASKGIQEYIDQINTRYYTLRDRGEIEQTEDIVVRCLKTEAYYQKIQDDKKKAKKAKKNKAAE